MPQMSPMMWMIFLFIMLILVMVFVTMVHDSKLEEFNWKKKETECEMNKWW